MQQHNTQQLSDRHKYTTAQWPSQIQNSSVTITNTEQLLAYTHTYTHTYKHTHSHTHTDTAHINTYIHWHTHTHIPTQFHTHTHTHTLTQTHSHTHTHTHTNTLTATQTDRQAGRQAGRQINWLTDWLTDSHTGRRIHWSTHTQSLYFNYHKCLVFIFPQTQHTSLKLISPYKYSPKQGVCVCVRQGLPLSVCMHAWTYIHTHARTRAVCQKLNQTTQNMLLLPKNSTQSKWSILGQELDS